MELIAIPAVVKATAAATASSAAAATSNGARRRGADKRKHRKILQPLRAARVFLGWPAIEMDARKERFC